MTADDLMRLINRYVEACDDLGEGLFEKPLTTTDALHAKATALHGQILDEVYRLHALAAAQPPAAMPAPATDRELMDAAALQLAEVFERSPDLLLAFSEAMAGSLIAMGWMPPTDAAAQPVPATGAQPLHITELIDWLAARYRAAGGKEGITDVSAWAEEVMRWTESSHGIGASPTAPTGSAG